MSFLSVLQSVGRAAAAGIAVVRPLAPFVPGIGSILSTVLTAATTVEQLIPSDAAAASSTKKQIVTSIVTAAHPEVDQAKLSLAIDSMVKALNDLSAALPGAQAAK